MKMPHALFRACPIVALVATIGTLSAQEPPAEDAVVAQPVKPARVGPPKVPTTADYGKWERLGRATLSQDGAYLAYGVSRNDGENKLHIVRLAAAKDAKTARAAIDYGSRPTFSADGKWVAYGIGMSEKAREKLTKAKKPARNKIGIRALATGETTEIENIASFGFSDDGRYLVMRRYKAKGQKHNGVDTLVRDLATGRDTSFGNVASYAWMDDGPLMAMVLGAADRVGNGILVYNAATGNLRTLDSAHRDYRSLTWREDADDLAVLRDREHEKDEDASFVVMTWRGLLTDAPKAKQYDHLADPGFPKDMRVVEHSGLRWSDDGERVFFGIKAWEHKPKPKKKKGDKEKDGAKKGDADAEKGDAKKPGAKKGGAKKAKSLRESLKDPAGVQVWHAKDIDIQPLQQKRHTMLKNKNFLAAWWLESDRFVQLGNDLTESVRLVGKQRLAVGLDNTPFETIKRFGPTLHDVYVIDVETGTKTKILERNKLQYGSSPDGRYVLYVKDNHIWSYDTKDKRHRNLTGDFAYSFINEEMSSLTDEKPAYGVAGWREDGSVVGLYDRYDLYFIKPDGSGGEVVTPGRDRKIRYRRVILDPDEDEFLRDDRPMYLTMTGVRSKRSGYAKRMPGPRGRIKKLIFKDKVIGGLAKAKDADVYAYTEQGFDDSPDVFVTGPDLVDVRRISSTNPFQKDYDWGYSELVAYKNKHGEELQGALHYPAGYVKGKKYPMIVYIYELRSQNLHRYSAPSERSAYNPGVFTTQGYFVLQPDIVYRPQNPGVSAVECVVPAVEKMIARGDIDPKKIGLVGHSWGAYQTAFIVTQTDLFAAGVAGAPLTNMMSMSMSIYWNSGQTDAWIFHESQGRMDKPFWRDVDTYIKNSPIFNIERLNTPLLVAFGDKDGAVDWHQGIEMYNAARLAQKPFVMLVYPGENHGLRKKPNQVDYHHRVRHWFDHHLKGEPAEPWVTEGKSHLEREKELDALKRKGKKGGAAKTGASSDAGK